MTNRTGLCLEHFIDCHGMQRPVGQRRISRFTGTDADGVEHCGTRGNVAIGRAAESSRGAGDPEHLIGSEQVPYSLAGAVQRLQGESQRGLP